MDIEIEISLQNAEEDLAVKAGILYAAMNGVEKILRDYFGDDFKRDNGDGVSGHFSITPTSYFLDNISDDIIEISAEQGKFEWLIASPLQGNVHIIAYTLWHAKFLFSKKFGEDPSEYAIKKVQEADNIAALGPISR